VVTASLQRPAHGTGSGQGPAKGLPEVTSLAQPRMRVWLAWLVAFYSVWVMLNFVIGYWPHTREHWPIAVAMAFGSYVAGSTPMGGGTVGFPVLVLFFDLPAALGRNFGLMVQSIGMTSASIFILCRRTQIEVRMLSYSVAGAAVGLLVGTFFVVPYMPDAFVKLVFSCLWASFGLLTLAKNRELCSFDQLPAIRPATARAFGLAVGLVGGVTTALTGVGIDMMLYTVLVLLFRMDLKAAVPTSVVIMAAASVMGSLLHVAIGDLGSEAFYNWLAAAPVVILGAPLGAFLVSIIPRMHTLYFVAVLCVLQFVWALYEIRPTPGQWTFTVANLIVATAGFTLLYRMGRGRAERATIRARAELSRQPRAAASGVAAPG